MGRAKKYIGMVGENIGIRHLKEKGYRVLHRNLATPFGEIDAVALKDGCTVFIEVKTRTTSSLGPPYLAVTGAKKRHIIKNALFYLKRYGLTETYWRVDVVSIKLDLAYGLEHIQIIENAVEDER